MAMPITRMRVVCTLGDTMRDLGADQALTRVDLPALGAPTMATKPARVMRVVMGGSTVREVRSRPGARPRACCRRGLGGLMTLDRDIDDELRRMRRPLAADLTIGRQRQPPACAHSCSAVLGSRGAAAGW